MLKNAVLSADGKYRYLLQRSWGIGESVTFIMLNPSTADAYEDDATIRKCISFAKSWGYSGLNVVNLYAYRATDPKELTRVFSPVGPDNDEWIRKAVAESSMVVAAWGNNLPSKERAQTVRSYIVAQNKGYVLRMTKEGQPSHPLYLSSDLRPMPLFR